MVRVKTVNLIPRNVTLPNERVGCVIAQPYPELTNVEPFRCCGPEKVKQLAVISRTLDLAIARPHGVEKTHFTIFPEYSVPGREGIDLIQHRLSTAEWPLGTVVIAGIDGLQKADYAAITAEALTNVEIGATDAASVPDTEWVNCAVVWIKDGNGVVERWMQPKLDRAKPEANAQYQQLFTGDTIYLFSGLLSDGLPFKFSALVCFDWIAQLGGKSAIDWILEEVWTQAVACILPITWMFVLQRNEFPSHNLFLQQVTRFFDRHICSRVLREDACIVFANNAGAARPGASLRYGGTSLVFSRKDHFLHADAPITVSNGGPRFRGSTLLGTHTDVYFREHGGCIHTFALTNPASVGPTAAGRLHAIYDAHVHPLDGNGEPRAPGGPVPASIKWVNDELDAVPALPAHLSAGSFAPNLAPAKLGIVGALRELSGQSANRAIRVAASVAAHSIDEWASAERVALTHIVHTLNLLAAATQVDNIGAGAAHALMTLDGSQLEIAAVVGVSHEACLKHVEACCDSSAQQVLLVSRDTDNTPRHWFDRSFLDNTATELGAETLITEPASRIAHIGYHDLTQIIIKATDRDALVREINARLAA